MVSLVEAFRGDPNVEMALVVSNRADAGGIEKAKARGLKTEILPHKDFPSREAFEAALDQILRDNQIDIICLAGFMRILTPEFVSKWRGQILNIHPSLLPLFTGVNTHQRALESGMAVHGASVHIVTGELDAGPILGQAVIKIRKSDTPDSIAARLLPYEHQLYVQTLREFLLGSGEKTAIFETE